MNLSTWSPTSSRVCVIQVTAIRAGVEVPVSPHWPRHANASHPLGRGAPTYLVQSMLGHASMTPQANTPTQGQRIAQQEIWGYKKVGLGKHEGLVCPKFREINFLPQFVLFCLLREELAPRRGSFGRFCSGQKGSKTMLRRK